MNDFIFYSPTKVIFGKDVENKVGEELKNYAPKKVMVHFGGGSVKKSGLLDRVEKSLKEAGIAYILFGGAVPNPRLSLVKEGAELAKAEGVDFVLAVGGGSAIDSAKGIAIAAVCEGDVWDIYMGNAPHTAMLPTANILTLSAAGSETSEHTVLTNEDGNRKIGYGHPLCRPKFTMMNPALTCTLPPYQTSCGIVDIMMHTLDRYFSGGGTNDLTDRIAEQVLMTTIAYGSLALSDPNNYEARAEVMWAGSVSHNDMTGLGRNGDWSPHMLEHELGGMYDVAHGAGLAAVWGSWARYVYKEDIMRFARYGVNVWKLTMNYDCPEETALAAISATECFFASIGMPISIPQLLGKKATDAEIDEMADKCVNYGAKTIGDFKVLDKSDVVKIFNIANQ